MNHSAKVKDQKEIVPYVGSNSEPAAIPGPGFRTTHWSVVLAAQHDATSQAVDALEQLCRTYWRSLYAFVRRQGASPHDAEDLVQGFFASFLEQHSLNTVDRQKGKFRSFLLAALKHFLSNERTRNAAQKRGGRYAFVSWEDASAEELSAAAEATSCAPELAFDQTWASTVLDQALSRLRADYAAGGKGPLFDALQVYLTGEKGSVPYAEMAARVELGESALKMAIQRLRRRFGEVLRDEIARTVSRPEEIDEELRALFAALRR